MTAREESMRRHPSRVARLIDAAQDEQAIEASRRDLADVEIYSGGPIRPMLPAAAPEPPVRPIVSVARALCAGLILYGLICVMGIVGAMFGGWPL